MELVTVDIAGVAPQQHISPHRPDRGAEALY